MKKLSVLLILSVFCLFLTNSVYAQTEIKGSGTSSTTHSLISTNSNSPVDTLMVVRDDGNVGIGTTSPNSKLEVSGLIHSTTGGIKFPDNSVQTTAATGGSVAYQNVITVAQAGGDFNAINAAISSLPLPLSAGNAYHIRVMPGIYAETFTLPQYVHLKGAGKHTTFIQGSVTMSDTCVIEDFNIEGGIVCDGTSPTILHNIITSGADNMNGIWVYNQGRPWIKENEIIDCAAWGILTQNFGSDPWIIANKILRNNSGGIKCEDTSPLISNNYIHLNNAHGIFLVGGDGTPAEPTIDDNVISGTSEQLGGIGIYMTNYAEPRIIANDIYICEYGIWIDSEFPQPSIIGNDINYNHDCGIYCAAVGSTKPVVIKSNHIHSNGNPGSGQPAGIWVTVSTGQGSPIITHNNIHNNPHDPAQPPNLMGWDINYSACSVPINISLNVFDNITNVSSANPPIATANGNYNVTSAGGMINP